MRPIIGISCRTIVDNDGNPSLVGVPLVLRQATPPYRRGVVPNHREVAKGTLRSIIRESGLTVAEFKALL